MTDSNDMLRRAQGCLFGQLIGDALGARYEFKSDSQVAAMVDEDRENNGFLPILGGGPFNMKPGQVTDDSEMALSLARSLVDLKKFSAPDIAASYVAWIQSNPPDRGITTEHALLGKGESQKVGPDFRMALSKEQKEGLWEEVKKRVHEWNANSLSNGALMRISPLGIATTRWNDERRIRRCVDEDVGMTHCHDLVKETVFAYVMAIRFLIKGESTEDAFNAALNSVHSRWARQCLLDSKKHANPVKLTDGREIYGDKEKIGFIGVALQGAFHELLHANTFAEGVERAVLRGGDTDTNGCIAAALLGAKFGEDGIPEEWKKSVKKAKRRDPTYSHLKTDDAKDLARRLLEEVEECD